MIFINFVPVSAGGGLQNALSFLSQIADEKYSEYGFNFIVACVKNGEIEDFCINNDLPYCSIASGFLGRISYELFLGYRLIRSFNAKVVFSLFGGAPIFSPKVYKISGFAYSNIIQPEIPFWDFLPIFSRVKKELTDKLRLFVACASDEIILETDYLRKRAETVFFKQSKIHVIKMTPSRLVTDALLPAETGRASVDILYLSGPHPNKRIHLLAEIFSELNKGANRYRLITTMPHDHSYCRLNASEFARLSISDACVNVGPINPADVGELLSKVDAIINVALLESFSNNWVEAWAAKLPLIATDAEWARASCGDAAIYIDPNDPANAAQRIIDVFDNPHALDAMRASGTKQLASLPTQEERFGQYMAIINAALRRSERV